MDFFDDDEPSAPTARHVGKFQPKAKAKTRAPPPKKESSVADPLVPRQTADNQLAASLSNFANCEDIPDSAATSNAGVKFAFSIEHATNLQIPSSAGPFVSSMENLSNISFTHMEENATSKDGENQCFHSGESIIESAEVFIGLDSVGDFIPQSTTVADATLDASNSHCGEDTSEFPVSQEVLSYKEAVSNNVEDIQLEKGQLETEVFTSLESLDFMSEVGASPGKRIGKFQPKLKLKHEKQKATVESVYNPEDTSAVPCETQYRNEGSVDEGSSDFPHVRVGDAFSTDPSAECLLNQVESLQASPDFIPGLPSCADAATACHLSSTTQLLQSSSGFIPGFPSSIDPLSQGALHEAYQQDPSLSEPMHSQSVAMVTKMVNEKGGTIASHMSNTSEETSLNSSAIEANKMGNLSHQCPKQKVAHQNVIKSVDEAQDNEGFAVEASNQLNVDEVDNSCGDNEEEKGSKKKKASSRSKKDANGSDKSVRKRKKTTEASEKSNEQPPKKFSHSTRRRNRSISKTLLETPEDEIDYQRLPIKDLIMLAEHREREKKEEDTRQTAIPAEDKTAAAPTERTDNNLWEDPPYDDYDDMYTSGQAGGSFDDPSSTSTAPTDTTYFNYQSHMNKTPRVKWSKQDTELFYEGVRQFGSDLSMIQHLFPGLTRHQIKLKYKKEERQQPKRLLDALTNRAKDLSHFQLVIGKLQEQINREEEQQRAEEEASVGATENEGSPEDGIAEIQASQEGAAKSEQNDDDLGAVQDPDGAKIGSPTESNECDFDTYDWSEYKSEF